MKAVSDHDLLVRIDERQKNIMSKVILVCKSLNKKVDDDKDYREMARKVDSLWDSKNKMIGWMIGAGATGGTLVTLVKGLAEKVLAR